MGRRLPVSLFRAAGSSPRGVSALNEPRMASDPAKENESCSYATVITEPARAPTTRLMEPPPQVATVCEQQVTAWEGYVERHADGTVFHTIGWRDAIKEAFGHEDHYLVAVRADQIVGLLPLFLIRSLLGGRMLVSVPCGVGGGIIANDAETVTALFTAAKALAVRLRCTTIDLRSDRAVVAGIPTVDRYVGFRRTLPTCVDEVPGWLPRKARAAGRNASRKFKLSVSFGDEHLAEVWRLYSRNMRRLASLSYPLRFFERLVEHTPKRHWTSIVERDGQPVAGLLTFLHRDRVLPYFFGCTAEARRFGAAHYIYRTAMERGVSEGYRVFDFGRSRWDNRGGFDFKRFHGFEPRALEYQRYTAPGHTAPDLSPTNPRFRLARRLWPRLPLCATRVLGAYLTKHIPG